MAAAKCSDEEFIRLFTSYGAAHIAEHLDTNERGVYKRRANIEAKLGTPINAPTKSPAKQYPHRQTIAVRKTRRGFLPNSGVEDEESAFEIPELEDWMTGGGK